MRQKITSILATHTVRQSAITTISTFSSAGLGAVFYLLLARLLGPREYGLYSLGLSIHLLIVTVADLGMGQGMVRFIGKYRDSQSYLPYAKMAFQTKLVVSAICAGLLWLFAPVISTFMLHRPEVQVLLPYVGFGVVSQLLFSFSLSLSQSLQKFPLWGFLQVSSNLIRLGLLGLLLLTPFLNAQGVFFIFSLAMLLAFGYSWVWFDRKIFSATPDSSVGKDFWGFNRWTALSMISSSVVSRLDTLITARYVSLSSLGFYSLAVTMVTFLPQLSAAVGAVTSSKFAGFSDDAAAEKYLRKSLLFSFGISTAVSAAMIPIALIVTRFAGSQYAESLRPFYLLLLSLFVFVSLNPLRDKIMFYHHRPQFFLWASIIQGLVLTVASVVLIPRFGITGSALAVLGSHLSLAVTNISYYLGIRPK